MRPRARASGRPQLELFFHAQPIGEDPTQEKAFRTAEVDEEKIARRHTAAAPPDLAAISARTPFPIDLDPGLYRRHRLRAEGEAAVARRAAMRGRGGGAA